MTEREQRFVELEVSQQKHLPSTENEMHVIVTIGGFEPGSPTSRAAEVILVDCSDSMDHPRQKRDTAVQATRTAIDTLPEDALFAVVRGSDRAEMVYPGEKRMAEAAPQAKVKAKSEVGHLVASGGTAIGKWLTLAGELLQAQPAMVRHVLLLTDGRNRHESEADLERVLSEWVGTMLCDARGIGEQWDPEGLLPVVQALEGETRAIAEGDDLARDFRETLLTAIRKGVPELRLHVQPRLGSRLRSVKQIRPTERDLPEHTADDPDTGIEIIAGPVNDETREYHLCLTVDATGRPKGTDLQVAKVGLIQATEQETESPRSTGPPLPILVHWTDEPGMSTRLDSRVRHYVTQGFVPRFRAGHELAHAEDGPFCPRDGADRVCPNSECGRIMPSEAVFCERCGQAVGDGDEPS